MKTYIVNTTDIYGRPVTSVCGDPYRFLALRVQEGILSAKQAAQTQVYEAEACEVDKGKLQAAIEWERLIEWARIDPSKVIERIEKKTMTGETLELLRGELRSRFIADASQYAFPWPWKEEAAAIAALAPG